MIAREACCRRTSGGHCQKATQRAFPAMHSLIRNWSWKRAVGAILLICHPGWVSAQPPSAKLGPSAKPTKPAAETPRDTFVEFELTTGADGGQLHSQRWLPVFESMDVAVQIRRGTAGDEPSVKEEMLGRLRRVRVVGRLERNGALVVPNRQFTTADSVKLKAWVDELKTFGALGSPAGQPNWGLTSAQFQSVYDSLTERSVAESRDRSLAIWLEKLALPKKHPLKWSDAANEVRQRVVDAELSQELVGFTKATALAIGLNEFSLGFQPRRRPNGEVELVVYPRGGSEELWPIGWAPKASRSDLAPRLFKLESIAFDATPLTDVVDAAQELSGVAILYDWHELAKERINPANISVKFPPKKSTWSMALRSCTFQAKMRRDIWQDESGRPFIWLTTLRAPHSADDE